MHTQPLTTPSLSSSHLLWLWKTDFISNWFPLTNSKAFASDWRYMVRFAHLKGTLFGSKCSRTPAVISDFSPASNLKSALLCTFTVYLETLGLQEWQHTSAVWVCTCQTVMCYAPGVEGQTYCPRLAPPMARCPCWGFPTMQRAPAGSREVGGAS